MPSWELRERRGMCEIFLVAPMQRDVYMVMGESAQARKSWEEIGLGTAEQKGTEGRKG